MNIEKLTVKNFKVLQDFTIDELPKLCVFVGANGVGKSTVFRVFNFLQYALNHGVGNAVSNEGGMEELRSREQKGNVLIQIKFRESSRQRLATYELVIGERNDRVVVERERLSYKLNAKGHGFPALFLDITDGSGIAVKGELSDHDLLKKTAKERREPVHLDQDSRDTLAIKALGHLADYPIIRQIRSIIEQWHISDIHVDDARQFNDPANADRLTRRGENLANVAKNLYDKHRQSYDKVIADFQKAVPEVGTVESKISDGRVMLKFSSKQFKDPFSSRWISDGTMKMFAYLILLHNTKGSPILSIEEPENQLYPTLLRSLVGYCRDYANTSEMNHQAGQVFLATHSPELLNEINVRELFLLEKGKDGFTKVTRANKIADIRKAYELGDKLGWLWSEGQLIGLNKAGQ